MVAMSLPYGDGRVTFELSEERLLGILKPRERAGAKDAYAKILQALENPFGVDRLSELVKPRHKVAIAIDDVTRPTPSHLMLPPVINELKRGGVKDENVKIIVACGTHRRPTKEELVKLAGREMVNRFNVMIHDCDATDLIYMGKTSFGTRVYINRTFADADVRIVLGDVNLHYYAGYGGGRKSVLPGLSGRETILQNHALLLHPNATAGNLNGNPVHADMMEAIDFVNVHFALNVVLNSKGEIIEAFAGDVNRVFFEGVKIVDAMYKIAVKGQGDVAIVSPGGYPLDLNLFQSMKALNQNAKLVRDGGILILVSECREGHGHSTFRDWMVSFKTLKRVEEEIRREFALGGHSAYYLLRALAKVRVYLVSSMSADEVKRVFQLEPFRNVNDALEDAFSLIDKARVWVVPHGNATLPILRSS
jgi:nickel-dependent lactate racemase